MQRCFVVPVVAVVVVVVVVDVGFFFWACVGLLAALQ